MGGFMQTHGQISTWILLAGMLVSVADESPLDGSPWASARQFVIEYEAELRMPGEPDGRLRRRIGLGAPNFFYFLAGHTYEAPRPVEVPPWIRDPFGQELIISNNSACARRPFNRVYWAYEMKQDSYLPASFANTVIWPCLPRWLTTDYKIPTTTAGDIPPLDEVTESDAYILRPEKVVVSGVPCRVYEDTGRDWVAIAEDRPTLLMKRELRSRDTGAVVIRFVTRQAEEFGDSGWFPKRFEYESFSQDQIEGKDPLIAHFKVKVLNLRLSDNLDHSFFEISQAPGSFRLGSKGEVLEFHPGGEELLDDVVDLAVNYVGLPTRRTDLPEGALLILLALVLGMLTGVSLLQSRHPAPPPSKDAS